MSEAIGKYVAKWTERGYSQGIPDEVPARLMTLGKAPSYRQIAVAILKNDVTELGCAPPWSPWYSELKRIEIEARSGRLRQLWLF